MSPGLKAAGVSAASYVAGVAGILAGIEAAPLLFLLIIPAGLVMIADHYNVS